MRVAIGCCVFLWACGGLRSPATITTPTPTPVATPSIVPSEGLESDLSRTQAFHATRPEYERPLGVGTQVPAGVGSMSAKACGSCHQELYEEWKVSTHALAWVDRQYQEEIKKSGNRWLCLNCHTPLLTQQDRWPVALQNGDVELPVLVDNPVYDEALREEGITCAACHVREGVVHGPGLGGEPPHPVKTDPDVRSGALCERCHQATATYPGKSFVCVFNTGDEWRAGPYDERGVGCVDCHMPAVQRPAAVGGPVREVRQHWWRGAGIPKVEGVHPPPEANAPGLGLAATWKEAAVEVVMTNANAGHMLPSGDPERWVQVDLVFTDAGGAEVGSWSHRIGQRWTWNPEPKKEDDNRLAPDESRTVQVPAPAKAVSAVVRASSHRMSEETANYHHLTDYPRMVQTHEVVLDRSGTAPQ